jgi:hypothetical protein
MDISVSSAAESTERSAPEPEAPKSEPAAPAARAQPHYPRGTGSSLPTGVDPAVMYKWLKIGGIALGAILLVVLLKMAFSGVGSSSAKPAQVQPAAPTLTLVAANPVTVRVQRKTADGGYGEVLFEGSLNRDERRTIPWPGELFVTASAGDSLSFEVGGRKVPMGSASAVQLPAPKR